MNFKVNNFDLLRLLAAFQVASYHAITELQISLSQFEFGILRLSAIFPGVPIFFFISGFLISRSFENNHNLIEYFQNRILRLYPGLIACVSLSFILIALSGYMASTNTSILDWAKLYFAKITFLQFYNPDFMRAYGDGVLNGSLWTITVEMQFYLLVPILYASCTTSDTSKFNKQLLLLIAVFLIINRIYTYIPVEYHDTVARKLARVSFFPWFYMFLVGVFAQRNFALLYRFLSNRFFIFLPLYLAIGYIALRFNISLGNNINPIIYLLLAMTVFSFAYSFTSLATSVLKGNDISYGVYIYHLPIINFILYRGYVGNSTFAIFACCAIGTAFVSWVLIEKPSLAVKKHPLNPLIPIIS